jgi:NAD(P)-dependent dehydrogenase (short-subunit alcohol dehydrogenase family)
MVSDRFDLTGKVVMITGASSGLGAAFAVGLAEAGCDLVLCARRVDRLEAVARRAATMGRAALAVPADVISPEACTSVAEAGMERFGRIDALVNNAGVSGAEVATRETPEHFMRIISVNLLGSFWMAQAAARVMKPGSSVVNLGSVLGTSSVGLPQAAYVASKAAVEALTRELAQQWTGRLGIRVNALVPGFFPSEMTDELPRAFLDEVVGTIPAGRLGEPDELVAALMFLLSPAASYVSGAALAVDGGFLSAN